MARHHHHSPRIVSDEFLKPSTNLHRGVPVVGEREDAAGILPPRANQVGDAMHQHPRLARAGPREHQDVRLLPIVSYNPALDWIVEALDDGAPGFRCGLA